MSKLFLSAISIMLLAGSFSDRHCSCRTALERDVPHGANELVEYAEKTVKRVAGRVANWDDGPPAEDVVVEIYEITPADRNLRPYEIVRRSERKTACITSKDGSFCFPHLPSGRYLVRAGNLSANGGMNEVFMMVKVDRRWWSRWFRPNTQIELALTPGT